MKNITYRISLCAVILAGTVLCADEAAQRRLGDAAFYAGDYLNAISSYKSALILADKENSVDGWAASALNLGVAYLHNGDIDGAKEIYNQFRKRFPLRSAGTLPGDIMAAESKYADAEAFFQSLLNTDPSMEDATNFSLATMYMKTGNMEKACAIFEKLAARNNSPWQASALNELLYTLIRLGKPTEAVAKIGAIPVNDRNADVELLLYLAEAHSGKISNLKANFNQFLQKMPPSPHVRLMELLSLAAEVAVRDGDHAFAADALNRALSFAVEPHVKQDLQRRLTINMLTGDPMAAAAEARRYSKDFPEAADRSQLILSVAGELYKKQMYQSALELYSFIVEGNFTEDDRLIAAAGAAECAEAMQDIAILERFIRFLIMELPLEEKLQRQCRYAAFLEKHGKYDMAEKELSQAVSTASTSGKQTLIDRLLFTQLEFYIRCRNTDGIRNTASKLEKSANRQFKAVAKLELGKLLESASLYQQSRKYFLEAAIAGYEPEQPGAMFLAALMAYKDFDFETAAAELLNVAEKYPEFAKTPEALFMAADIYTTAGNEVKAAQAADTLHRKYPSSQAAAAWILRAAAESSKEKNNDSVIAELQDLERNFAGTSSAGEAALLRAKLTDRQGKTAEALKILQSLHDSDHLSIRAESMMQSAEILFRQKDKLSQAREMFLRCAAVEPGSLRSDVARGRAGDCVMADKTPLKAEALNWCITQFDQLAHTSNFPQIRIQAFFKAGSARKISGNIKDAISCYEKAIYAACDMANQGITADPVWSMRSCEAALELIAEQSGAGALQHGLQLIERCERLSLPEPDFTNKMRNNFRKQLKQRR